MMPAMPRLLAERLTRLAHLFNGGSLDLPDGLIDRGCVFRLNGVAYEDTMGRPVTDPIVRMIARGPAAYRFLAQAVRYALPDAHLGLSAIEPAQSEMAGLVTATATLEGTLRATHGGFTCRAAVALVTGARGRVCEVAVMLDEALVAAIAEARRR